MSQKKQELMKRLDGYRTSYFMNWLMPKWLADPKRLESVSLAEIVAEYDKEQEVSADNLKHAASEQQAVCK